MNNLTPTSALTFETLMASIHESNRLLTEQRAETDRLFKEERAESDRLFKEQRAETEKLHQETAKLHQETAKLYQETAELHQETAELYQEIAKQQKENWDKYEKRMKRMEKDMGSWSNNQGSFAEEYFYNSFDEGKQNFFGEEFDDIEKNLKPKSKKLKDEYDIVLYNHSSVAIIEVKFKAHENDVAKTLKKAETFRILCPDYKDFKIYLGLASMSFFPELEKKCTEEGIAIIKQMGDAVVINDAHLKVF